MRQPTPVPPELRDRAFSRQQAIEAGITPRMLQHRRFVQVHPSVYRLEGVELDDRAQIAAAALALPADARVSHTTRLRLSGLDIGDLLPLHFTVARDLHLAIDDVLLHRTVRMPPTDDHGIALGPAFIQTAAMVSRLELVTIGDWLLHRGLLNREIVRHLARRDLWRPGAASAEGVLAELDPRARSLPESELRVILGACGLPLPEVNADVFENGEFLGCGDLVFRQWRLVVEYEGRQHAFSTQQFRIDIDRYRRFRRYEWAYLQVTHEDLARPRALVAKVYDELVRRGYDGPPPQFGPAWHRLFGTPDPREPVDLQRHSA
jgi:hypothetical protein